MALGRQLIDAHEWLSRESAWSRKRPSNVAGGTSEMCQKLTHALQQRTLSLDYFVGAQQKRRGHIEIQRLGGPQVDDRLELGRPLDRNVGWLSAF
jgi:hypothetical protein